MNKFLCAAVVLSTLIPSYALADQTYQVVFVNKSYATLSIAPNGSAGKCFSLWNVPSPAANLTNKSGNNETTVRVTDKNSGNCINAEKKAAWTVTPAGSVGQVITMDHQHANWTTQVISNAYDKDPAKNQSIIKKATCQIGVNPSSYVDCYNKPVSGLPEVGTIIIEF
ncbi:hypothetical protein HGG72_02110 [Ochrobactrum pecoris]|uniref:Secreted protein n=1 Tax=Brucella pecoris TaxID=867683 RepID=A0A5C5CNI4_9HYPH|nr:hypothetical protein [Brucella pecoris]MBB4093904.1 hypothetical protein [Brucella pecoris]NKW79390.1 hypothetical protein [Brucella pecoris]TNV12725.1 hypothetical protein FIB18_09255 [Brucella pecoris]